MFLVPLASSATLSLAMLLSAPASASVTCELVMPPADSPDDGPEFGLITVPGAQIEGEAYKSVLVQ